MLTFTIDGFDLGHPINWRDVKIKYSRDRVVRGLFTTYSSELKWTGAAYKYLKAAFVAGVCSTVAIKIEQQDSIFSTPTTLIEGETILSQVKWDDILCSATAPIEQSGCIGKFFRDIDSKVDVGSYGTPAGGTAWLEVLNTFRADGTIRYFDIMPPPCGVGFEAWTPVGGVYSKTVKMLFTQIVDLVSDGCLGFVSDYMSVPNTTESWLIRFTGAMNVGDVFKLEWDDILGNHHICKFTSTGVIAQDIILLERALNSYANGDFTFVTQTTTSRFRKGEVAYFDVTSPTSLTIYWHLPPVNLTKTHPSGTFSLTQTTVGSIGALNYEIVPGLFSSPGNYVVTNLAGINWAVIGSGSYKLSFRELFTFVNSLWNLGMTIEPDGLGGWRVRIEPIAYFFAAPVSVTLRDIKDVTKSTNESILAATYFFGKDSDPVDTYLTDFNPEKTTPPASVDPTVSVFSEWWVNTVWQCVKEKDLRTKELKFIVGLGASFQAALLDPTSGSATNVVPLLEPEFSYMINVFVPHPHDAKGMRYTVRVWWSTVLSCDYTYYYYDVQSQPEMVYYNHLNILPEHSNWQNEYTTEGIDPTVGPPVLTLTGGYATIPEGDYFLPYIWDFTRYISYADFVAILASQQIAVNQGSDPSDDLNTYISEIEYRVFDGSTKFRLEAKL